ncbi:MAG: alpha-ketoglutarate-dependent dioxygenase AlkB [Sphingomonadales bacterium]|nr:alpha-ketoglutarate-dependent dioxygenase AlkB [Sphingomonadales bacterium]
MSPNPLPPGLKLARDVMTSAEEAALIERIEASGLAYYAYDPGNPRSSTSFGWKYDFQSDRFVPCAAIPEGFSAIADRAAEFAGLACDDFAECLLNRYEPGAVIQPHCDKPVWEHVIGISLGAPATMVFRHQDSGEERPVALPPRSIYLLADDARYVWQHSLPPMQSTRYSITFRTFSAEGLRRLEQCSAEI